MRVILFVVGMQSVIHILVPVSVVDDGAFAINLSSVHIYAMFGKPQGWLISKSINHNLSFRPEV